ncbi:MAG: aldo/keto reductase [Kribbellaceae bacterium]|nr:aldo/keto reductase [Kribbellaceae bacterium]
MQQRYLGHSGLRVGRLALGTMSWGRDTDEHEAREQLTAFVAAGGTLVDTAAAYGEGVSEKTLGALIGDPVQRVAARDELVIATKAGFTVRRGARVTDTSRGALLRDLDDSLRRLRTDYVDLWQVHTWSDDVALTETLSALDAAVASGKVRYVGLSNYTGWQLARAVTWQQAWPGRAVPVSDQVEYSLLNRGIETELVPAAVGVGVGVLPWSPLGRGVLTGKYRTSIPADSRAASAHLARFVDPYLDNRGSGIVEAVARAADGLGWTALEVALTWVRDRPGVTAPIVGARTATQLKSALATEDLVLPPAIGAALEDVS